MRDNDGSIVQFTYGDDGIDVMNTKFLDKFKFMENNHTVCYKGIDKFIKSGVVDSAPVEKAKIKD